MKTPAEMPLIYAARRTPLGGYLGALAGVPAPQLGATAIRACLGAAADRFTDDDEVIMGCVLPAGLGQAPARQAALGAGLPLSVGASTISKVCGSGMKAVMLGSDALRTGSARWVIAGGMESMSNAPHLVRGMRSGVRFGHQQMLDHMFLDGLENAADNALMGCFAESCAREFAFSRNAQDQYAIESVRRAMGAMSSGAFDAEIAPVTVAAKDGSVEINQDEQPPKCKIEKIPQLKPAFDKKAGTVTAANSSSISDGAAALLLAMPATAGQLGMQPLARIVGYTNHAQAPEAFTTAPIGAIQRLLARVGWKKDDVDLYEINEAFAVVAMAAIKALDLSRDKVNVNGGACSMGHPIGASGARIIVTLVHALRKRNLKRGVAALCIGGGEATAIAIEVV